MLSNNKSIKPTNLTIDRFLRFFNLKYLIRIVCSAVFFISAISKLLSIDNFEIFIFSLQFVNLNVSFVLARLVIGFELILAIMILIGTFNKLVITSTIITLFSFSIFLIIREFSDKSGHCHCFGELIVLNNIQSIAKNVVLMALMVFLYNDKEWHINKFLIVLIVVPSLVAPFIISPPDIFPNNNQENSGFQSYNPKSLEEYFRTTKPKEGFHVYGIISINCNYCKLAIKKLDAIVARTDHADKVLIHHWSQQQDITKLYKELNVPGFPSKSMTMIEVLKITNGRLPLILLLHGDSVVSSYNYSDLRDKDVILHLNKNTH